MNGEPNTDGGGSFPSTQWTLIIHAIQQGNNDAAEAALARFCEKYRPAIVRFFRRRGCSPELAEDYAQDFFLTRIHHRWADRGGLLFSAERSKTKRFRSFLAHTLHCFLIEQWRKRKNPGDAASSAADPGEAAVEGEGKWEDGEDTIQPTIDRELAVQTIGDAIKRAQPSPYHIKFWNSEISQKDAAAALNQSEDAFTQSYKRFRDRLRNELRKAVAEMIEDSKDVDSEIKYFLSIFARQPTSLPDDDSRISH